MAKKMKNGRRKTKMVPWYRAVMAVSGVVTGRKGEMPVAIEDGMLGTGWPNCWCGLCWLGRTSVAILAIFLHGEAIESS